MLLACVVYTKTIIHLGVGESDGYLPPLRCIIVNYNDCNNRIFILNNPSVQSTIPYHRKYSGQHNQSDIRVVHDGKVGCNTVEFITAFLYFDWLYLLWHGTKLVTWHIIFLCALPGIPLKYMQVCLSPQSLYKHTVAQWTTPERSS